MTKNNVWFVLILTLVVSALSAQTPGETILASYERIFIRSSLNTKVNVLSDAAHDESAAEFYGPLCEAALRFVINNAALFSNDPDMINIAVAAVRGVGEYAYNPAAETLWQAFLRLPDNVIRYEILETLPALDTRPLTEKINEFIAEQNRRYKPGMDNEYQILLPLFAILAKTGDESSYPVLFSAGVIYKGPLEEKAVKAFFEIDGNVYNFFVNVILNNPHEEKLYALKLVFSREGFSGEEKSKLAETALEIALALPGDKRREIQELGEMSLAVIEETGWIRALPQVFKYYNQSLAAFRYDMSGKQALINAINCLGNLKSVDAAQILTLQLGLYNSRFSDLQADEYEVVLALIHALGRLGYKASYDALHYASILSYPEEITEAARKALANLKW